MSLETGRWKTRRDLPVWIALAVLLAVGWTVKGSVEGRTALFADPAGTLRVRYPAGWFAVPGSTALLEVSDPRSGAGVPTTLVVRSEPQGDGRPVGELSRAWILNRSRQLDMYRVLSNDPAKVAGREAVAISYAFVADPHAAALDLQRIPVVVRGLEFVVPAGRVVYHVDFQAADSAWESVRPTLDGILSGVQL